MTRKTGDKWDTAKCGRCGEKHEGLSGKLDADNVEYVVCPVTNKRMNIKKVGLTTVMYVTEWEKQGNLT